MERERYIEITENLSKLLADGSLASKDVYLFAHCGATMELADELIKKDVRPVAILDNNPDKYEIEYKGIPVCDPHEALKSEEAVILIVSRFYEQMVRQMRRLGFEGDIEKLTDYNSYTEYSLSPDTLIRKSERLKSGMERLKKIKSESPGKFIVLCPFPALGDIYLCMSYLKAYMNTNGYNESLVCVVGNAQKQVVDIFGYASTLMLSQRDIDEVIQAVIYTDDKDCYIAHQDRPYVVDLHRALYKKCIPLENIYKCGIFGLPQDTDPVEPACWKDWDNIDHIESGNAVVLSPYAKSVPALPDFIWEDIVSDCKGKGIQVFTNVCGVEKPLRGTEALNAELSAMKSILESAGTFIGIRSGLCDVVRTAKCRKIALYPDYYYCDTKWKSIDMYFIEGFENIVVKEGFRWKTN